MKPPEILGLLEEAAGTKMYETKKQAALRTLEKKQLKVDEINKVLSEDIMPALDKLRKEKVQYMEWQNASSKMERLQRFCVAYKYTEAKELLRDGEAEVQEVMDALSTVNVKLDEAEEQIKRKNADLKSLQNEKATKSSGEVDSLSQQTDSLSKQIIQETSRLDNVKDAYETETKALDLLQSTLKSLNEEVIKQRIETATKKRDQALSAVEIAIDNISAAQSELAGAEAGDGRDSSNRSLQERLEDTNNAITETEGSVRSANKAVQHQSKQLDEAKMELKSKEKTGSKVQREFEKEQQELQKLKAKLQSLKYNQEEAHSIEAKIQEEQDSIRQIGDNIDQLSSQLAASEFNFQDPIEGFDRSKVKGVVSRLVTIADPKYASALEVAAGGKLYQVIVDNEQTAKQLLSNGRLKNRVTIIPLNKVSARILSEAAKKAANAIAGADAVPALELVGYDEELRVAMQYTFGSSFVCKDTATAKQLAFHKDIASRCVTLDGDDFNPSGTLTGGSRNKSNCILSHLHALAQYETDLKAHQMTLSDLSFQLAAINKEKAQYIQVKKEVDIKAHSLELLQRRLEGSVTHQLMQAVIECEAELKRAEEFERSILEKLDTLKDLRDDLTEKIENFDRLKGGLIDKARMRLKKAKHDADLTKARAKEEEAALQEVIADSESAAKEKENIREQINATTNHVENLKCQIETMHSKLQELQGEYDALCISLEEKKSQLRQCDAEISQIEREIGALEIQMTNLNIEKKKHSNRVESLRKGSHTAEDKCKALEREYPWIQAEECHFGTSGSDYDWISNDPIRMFEEYENARLTIDALSKRVNKKVMQMFEKAEHEYTELQRKKDVVEADKAKIRDVMHDLDEKKKEALKTTWKKVDKDLGSIFATLLPGTMAKLEPVEGTSFMDGLEVKVSFGGVWKDSLSELSGGQKSLLALSLILAMLLFKPAPIYILDEVDAALDLSHTQNIGRMIKSHFPQSQFIVVSLKEGMFSNANVIFRTKFVDGVSTVTRTINNAEAKNKTNRQPLKENPQISA